MTIKDYRKTVSCQAATWRSINYKGDAEIGKWENSKEQIVDFRMNEG